ncbi:MAG: hypothetical protein IJY66_03685, partial [Clostridia bacterium]|nr:hypothetical protein [Clostridia bacterium]
YVEGSACTKGEAAQMIYDCLFADYARLTANLNVIHNADDHDDVATLIEDVFGLVRASDKQKADSKCTQHKWVIVAQDCTDEDVIWAMPVDDKTNEIEGAPESFECTADVSALIGYEVALWGEDEHATANDADGEIDIVKAVEVLEGQVTYEFNPTMADDDMDGELEELDDLEVSVADERIMSVKNGNSYVLFDWDNDGDVDYWTATERFYADVTALTSKKVVLDVATENDPITLDLAGNDTEEYEEYCFVGEDEHDYVVDIASDVEEGDVVEIVVDDAYESTVTITITKVEASEKEFTNWKSNGDRYFDETDVLVDAEDAVDSSDYTVDGLKKAQQDDSFDIWVDANGYVIKMADPAAAASEYLMVLGVADGEYVGVASKNTKAAMEVMYTDGTTAEIELAFDAEVLKSGADQYDNDKAYVFTDESAIVGGVYKYELNSDGDVEKMVCVYDFTSHAYSYDADYESVELSNGEDLYLTGEDFVFVVDEEYVSHDTNKHGKVVYTVDTDLVAVLAMDELKDIDTTDAAAADEGAYATKYAVWTEWYNKNQNNSKDYIDGMVMVVDDLDEYLDTKTTKVGLITEIDYSGKKDLYTFTMYLDGAELDEYVSVEVKETESATKIADAVDAGIIEDIADDVKDLKDFGNGLYAAVTFNKEDKISNIELLDTADYSVVRGVVSQVGKDSFRIMSAEAASDKKIASIDEYMDVAYDQFKYGSDLFVYVDEQIPGMAAGVELDDNIAFHKDSKFSVGSKSDIVVSEFNDTALADIYNVVDVIYEINDDNEMVAVGVFAFDEVEEDTAYVAPVVYTLTADTSVPGSVAAHLFADGVQVAKADVDVIADSAFSVWVYRAKADQSDVSDEGTYEWVKLTIDNVKSLNAAGDMGIFFAEGSALAANETAYVVLEGAMGDVALDVDAKITNEIGEAK